jgi:hypothetical protein
VRDEIWYGRISMYIKVFQWKKLFCLSIINIALRYNAQVYNNYRASLAVSKKCQITRQFESAKQAARGKP